MKRGKLILILILILPLIGFVNAIETEITINTLPHYNIYIGILKPHSVYYLVDSFSGTSNYEGEFSVVFSSEMDVIDIGVWVRKNNQLVVKETFKEYYTGSPIKLEVYPEGYAKPEPELEVNETQENETVENQTEVNETEVNETITSEIGGVDVSPGITGAATEGEGNKGFFVQNLVYFVVGFIVLFIVIFMGSLAVKRKKGYVPREIKIIKPTETKKDNEEDRGRLDNYKKAIEDAERKIEDAQKQIKKLKNEDKIKEMRDKITKEQEELEKLEKGED